MGEANLKSVSLSTIFGAASSCSFAALAAARSLVKKGWRMVGNSFVSEWKMVWEEILI